MDKLDESTKDLISIALAEDHALQDITTRALIPRQKLITAHILAKANGIIAGGYVAQHVFWYINPELKTEILIHDGSEVKPDDIIMIIRGNASNILNSERVALNFLQHLSGIATETARYVQQIRGLKAQITDTRKTIPGFRSLQKYAVRKGGANNHRMHLADAVLIKDNHIALLKENGFTLKGIIEKARKNTPPNTKIEIEVITSEEALEAAEASADTILLDNMSILDMSNSVKLINRRAIVEASGGITLSNVRDVAETGVDLISIGALTHSVKALDIALEII